MPGDMIITAIGQRTDLGFLGEDHGLETSPRGLIAADPRSPWPPT
jgi:hypothetical protein